MLAQSAEVPVGVSAATVPAPFEILSKRKDTTDTFTFELRPRSGEPLVFLPGQCVMLSRGGSGEVPISISGDPDVPERLVHTVRSLGLRTAAICSAQPGEVLGVRGPWGQPWPVVYLEGSDIVIAAGGIGLAPLRSAILWLLARRERYGRLVLLYGARNPEQLLYRNELEEWAARGMEVLETVDSAGPEWLGSVGVVTRLVRRAHLDAPRTAVLCCGPEVMMKFMVEALLTAGVGTERMYVSMERNMQCGIGHCGHCQLGPTLICKHGPVYRWSKVEPWIDMREL
jgi:NAD(P)H-flavin reductase